MSYNCVHTPASLETSLQASNKVAVFIAQMEKSNVASVLIFLQDSPNGLDPLTSFTVFSGELLTVVPSATINTVSVFLGLLNLAVLHSDVTSEATVASNVQPTM